jgi:chromosome segregation ATPase
VADNGVLGIDIARQSTLLAVQQSLTVLSQKVGQLMSQDATVAAEVADIDTKIAQTNTLLATLQQLIVSLQAETGLTPATLDLIARTQADAAALETQAQADVTADTPPAPPAA